MKQLPPTLPISITTDSSKIFKQYLHILNPMLPQKSKLTDKEISVLGTILQVNHLYRNYPIEVRSNIIFHPETKKKMREAIKQQEGPISVEAFNNIMLQLRTKGFLSKDRVLHNVPLDEQTMSVRIHINLLIEEKK